MSVVDLSTIKEYIPELSGSTGSDTELTALRDRVESAVARYLGFPAPDSSTNPVLDVATYTFFVDSPTLYDGYTLQLPIAPIVSVTSVHASISRQYDANSLIAPSNYTFSSISGRIYLDPNITTKTFVNIYRGNKVVLTAGYSSVTFPDDAEHAICVWVSQLHRNKSNQGKDQVQIAGNTVKITPKHMPFEVKELLNPIRCPELAL